MYKYEEGKKVRRIAAVIYLLIVTIIVGITYFTQQDREKEKTALGDLPLIVETRPVMQ
jgi:hypothetical protein